MRDTGAQSGEEGRRVPSAGASVPVELGCAIPTHGCVPDLGNPDFRDFYGGSSRGHGPLLILSPEVEGFKLLITAWSFR